MGVSGGLKVKAEVAFSFQFDQLVLSFKTADTKNVSGFVRSSGLSHDTKNVSVSPSVVGHIPLKDVRLSQSRSSSSLSQRDRVDRFFRKF